MASKGQKHLKYPIELKEQILKEYFEENKSSYYIARKHRILINTVKNWIRKARHEIDITIDHRQGRSGRSKTKN